MADIWFDVDTELLEVPVNKVPLIDDTDFKTVEASVVSTAAGMDLVFNRVTSSGGFTQTAVTLSTTGDYLWTNQAKGMYSVQIPASTGSGINNDTEGFGWFNGVATGVLPWISPILGFRDSGINDILIESPYSTTQGLAGDNLDAAITSRSTFKSTDTLTRVTLVDTVSTLTGHTGQSGDSYPTVNTNLDATITSRSTFGNTETLARVTLVDTVSTLTGHTGQSGDSYPTINTNLDAAITSRSTFGNTETLARVTLVDTTSTLTGHTGQSGDSYPTVNTNLDAAITSRSTFKSTDTVTAVTTVATLTGHTAQSGDSYPTVNTNLDAAITSRNSVTPDAAGTAAALHITTDGLITSISGGGIKKGVALSNFPINMTLASDDITPGTGLTVLSYISKDGAAFSGTASTVVELSNGVYLTNFSSDEMNADTLTFRYTSTAANETQIMIKTSS